MRKSRRPIPTSGSVRSGIRKQSGNNPNLSKKRRLRDMVTEISMNMKFFSFKPFALWLKDPNKMLDEQLGRSGVTWRASTEVISSKPDNWELDLKTLVVNDDGEKTSEDVLSDLKNYMFSTSYEAVLDVTAEK
jgi:hypothetical protein